MKAKKYLAAVGLFIAGSAVMSSCIQKNYYVANPNNQNNNNNGYSYVFDEEFNGSDNYGWTFTDATDSAYASITNGSYQYVDYSAAKSNFSVVNTGLNITTGGNFTVQTRIESNNTMGLIFGASSTDNGYAFYIDSLGNYSLYKEGTDSVASTVIIAATADSGIVKKGWNTMELDQTNGNWTGYINGTQVFQRAASAISGAYFGFKVLPATVGYADYLTVKSAQ